MQVSGLMYDEIVQYYTAAVEELWKIARAYFFLGRLNDARHLLDTSLSLLETDEAQPRQRLKLLLLYGQVLSAEHLLVRGEADLLLATARQARQVAEESQDQQGIADALGLLGEVHYFSTLIALMKGGASPNSPRGSGKYDEALAYQQQALALREALHDTRGISASSFQVGVIYERWQEADQAQTYYKQARQIAEQYDHPFEKVEPTRHMALDALRQGQLEQALSLALQAIDLREAVGFSPYLPIDFLLVRDIYHALGDAEQARLYQQKAATLAEEIGFPALVSSMPANIRDLLTQPQGEA